MRKPASTLPCVHHVEQIGPFELVVSQPWAGAGLEWRVRADHPILGRFDHTSGGRFYPDQHGEIIHGETIDDVVRTAVAGAKKFLGIG